MNRKNHRTPFSPKPSRSKTALGIGLVLATSLLGFASRAAADCTIGGSGTPSDPYLVGTYDELEQVGDVCGMGAHYVLKADIDAAVSDTENNRKGFVPIGNKGDTNFVFTGTFRGAGFSIKNLKIVDTVDLYVGLFGSTLGAKIDSLSLTNVRIVGKVSNAGGIAGYNQGIISNGYLSGSVTGGKNGTIGGIVGENAGTISSCHTLLIVASDTESILGGIAGINDSAAYITNSYSSGSLTSKTYSSTLGGVVGLNLAYGTVSGSHSEGTITGGNSCWVGGVAGENAGIVDNSYASGTIVSSGFGSYIGGVVGWNDSASMINASYSAVPVYCDNNCLIGGVAGKNSGGIRNSYSTDSVMATTNGVLGGVAGESGIGSTIRYCYASGRLVVGDSATIGGVVGENSGILMNSYGNDTVSARGNSRIGGLVGSNEASGSISNCYAIGRAMAGMKANLGGIAGENRGSLTTSFAVVSFYENDSNSSIGGAVGMNAPGGSISNIYWNLQVSQQNVGVGYDASGTGGGAPISLNTTLMHDSTYFTGFHFGPGAAWSINQGRSFPSLQNMVNAPGVGVFARPGHIFYTSLRQVGQTVRMELASAAKVRVVDPQGRQIMAETDFAPGSRVLDLPSRHSTMFVLVKTAQTSSSLIVEPVR